MAMSATIALVESTIAYNQRSSANVTISNSSASPVTILTLQPQILPDTSNPNYEIPINTQSSDLPKGFGQAFVAPATGSVVVPFDYLVFSPQVVSNGNLSQSVPVTYSVGCNIYSSDGSSFAPTPATVTITPITAN
jgi:hypothetical protein